MQEAELMIGHCRDIDLLSTIVILFLICGSELFIADINGFSLKMIFTQLKPIVNIAWIIDVNKPTTFVNSKIDAFGSVSKF